MRVFVLERPRGTIDLGSAKQFGELVLLFGFNDRRPSVFAITSYAQSVVSALNEHKFDPMVDAFYIVGSLLNTSLAMMALMLYAEEHEAAFVNLVYYSANTGECYLKQLDIEPIALAAAV